MGPSGMFADWDTPGLRSNSKNFLSAVAAWALFVSSGRNSLPYRSSREGISPVSILTPGGMDLLGGGGDIICGRHPMFKRQSYSIFAKLPGSLAGTAWMKTRVAEYVSTSWRARCLGVVARGPLLCVGQSTNRADSSSSTLPVTALATSSASCAVESAFAAEAPAWAAFLPAAVALISAWPASTPTASALILAPSAVVFAPLAVLSASCANASSEPITCAESSSFRCPYGYATNSQRTAIANSHTPNVLNRCSLSLFSVVWANASAITNSAKNTNPPSSKSLWARRTESSEFQSESMVRGIISACALLSALAARILRRRRKWEDRDGKS